MNPVEEDRALDGEDDPAHDMRRGREAMDPATRQLAFIASGIGLLLVVVVGGWLLAGRHSRTIPVIEAPSAPVRVKPIDPGGMQAMGAQAPSAVSGAGGETLAPTPEAPRPEALQAEIDAARQGAKGSQDALTSSTPAPATHTPATTPAPAAHPEPPPVADPPVAPAPGPLLRTEAAPENTMPGPAGHDRRLAVQLAALESQAAAKTEWTRLCRSHPALFSGRASEVERIDRDGRSIYRLRMGGFASAADASAFCEQARAQRVACTLADF